MNDVELRIPVGLSDELLSAIQWTDQGERVVFGLISHAQLTDPLLLLVQSVLPLPDDAYLSADGHGARWRGSAMLQVINRAIRDQLGIVIFHAHSFGRPVRLSGDDRSSGTALLQRFGAVCPDRPHASVVVGPDSAAGLVWHDGRLVEPARFGLKFLSDHLDVRTNASPDDSAPEEAFDRQVLAVGSTGQRKLRQTTAAVVGLGGGGSHEVQQLAHVGIGKIVGIDADLPDETNRSRTIGLTGTDVLEKRSKVAVAARLVETVGLGTEFIGIEAPVPSEEAVEAIKKVDLIIGCVDNYHARADLQDLAWRFLIPYVDIGLVIDPAQRSRPGGEGNWIAGNVYTLLPGSACLWCTDFLTQEKLDRENDGRDRTYFKGGGPAAQVVSMNAVLAGAAVNEILQLITGFCKRRPGSRLLRFNGVENILQPWRIEPSARCQHCRNTLAAGVPLWTSAASRAL